MMSPLTASILEQKRLRRQALASLPFPEKIRIVEKLREASQQIAAAAAREGMRKQPLPARNATGGRDYFLEKSCKDNARAAIVSQ
jgi:hypothetical protein